MEQDLVKFRKLWFVRHDILAGRQLHDWVEFKIRDGYHGYLDCGIRDFSIFFYRDGDIESICYFRKMEHTKQMVYRRTINQNLLTFEQFFDIMKEHGLAEFLLWEVLPI